jgi:hypothetical protein
MPESIVPNVRDRAAIDRANAQKSNGPRTAAGKQRSSLNALRHGLTGHTIVLPTEDLAAYQRHSHSFLAEYQPRGATESLFSLGIYRQLDNAAKILKMRQDAKLPY